MTIKKKLLLSNILMVAIPVTIAAILIVVGVLTVGNRYWKSTEAMYKDENGITTAQNLIYAYDEEFYKTADKNYSEAKNKKILKHAIVELGRMGYHFSETSDGKVVYSNLTSKDHKTEEYLAGGVIDEVDTLSVGYGDRAVIKQTFQYSDKGTSFFIIAVNNNTASYIGKYGTYIDRYILPYIIFFVIAVLLAIILTSFSLSRWIARNIMPPLRELRNGSREIMAGNLDATVTYDRDDEFGEVCGAFDEMRRHLKLSTEEQVRYEEYRRELISGISHDLRTPLTTIRGYVDGMIDGIADTDEKRMKYLRAIQVRTGDLERLVDDLSMYNKMENKSYTYDMRKMNINAFLDDYVEKYSGEMMFKKAVITLEHTPGRTLIRGDEKQLQRVMDNIIINSIKYMDVNKDKVHVSITAKETDDSVVWTVADDGPGVAGSDLEKIFESFMRLDKARTGSNEGNGLGLSIVKSIVEDHGGTVRAESENGLSIIMTLPLIDEQERKDG